MEQQKNCEVQLADGVVLTGPDTYRLSSSGGSLVLRSVEPERARYLLLSLELLEEHSGTFQLMFYETGEPEPGMILRFGILPRMPALLCFDLCWLDGHILFPGHTPGQLKVVCHGRRVEPKRLEKLLFQSYPCFHDIGIRLSGVRMATERPANFPLKAERFIDGFGQYARKDWPGKIGSVETLKTRLNKSLSGAAEMPENRTKYGGDDRNRLAKGTGFFSKIKKDNRWYLLDPRGHAFFSMGPDCVVSRSDGRIDGMESFCEGLPEAGSREHALFCREETRAFGEVPRGPGKSISYEGLNLYRVWGEDWYENFKKLVRKELVRAGMNTLGNWSDERLFGELSLPYVTSLSEFPDTPVPIFRDFPDVFDPAYESDAIRCAKALEERRDDEWMVGYFLRNEPGWAFVDNLVIADEVLRQKESSHSKRQLIAWLRERYGDITRLNEAWHTDFAAFGDLQKSIPRASGFSGAASADLHAFSRIMLRRYVEVPSKACRAADPNHMILGMRWAWISDPDIVSGWENFDVFSINCYAVDPTTAIDNVRELGVDLPVMIGEFHFGALDGGLTATGLEGVQTQKDRELAYRYYCHRVAAHPQGVGCHYFQFYDQFPLGRFDGENYNIGLFDVCTQPYADMMDSVRRCSEEIYRMMDGSQPPCEEKAESIPMIAY